MAEIESVKSLDEGKATLLQALTDDASTVHAIGTVIEVTGVGVDASANEMVQFRVLDNIEGDDFIPAADSDLECLVSSLVTALTAP